MLFYTQNYLMPSDYLEYCAWIFLNLFCIDLIYLFLWIYLVTIYGSLSVWTFQKLKQ